MKRSEIKRRPLSDTTLAGLEPELKEYRELDANGLYFRVKPDGQKSWQLRYKKTDGKWSWLGLGGYPEVSGAAARAKAADLRADTAEGRNPMVTKQARKAAEAQAANDTFETLAREWHASRIGGWDAGTAKRIMGALERHVFPTFGQRRYTGILSMEWMELLRGLEQQGILEQMSRVRAYCKDVYDLARVTGRAVNNPLEGIHKFLSSGKAENYAHVSAEELPALLRAIQSYPHAKDVRLSPGWRCGPVSCVKHSGPSSIWKRSCGPSRLSAKAAKKVESTWCRFAVRLLSCWKSYALSPARIPCSSRDAATEPNRAVTPYS